MRALVSGRDLAPSSPGSQGHPHRACRRRHVRLLLSRPRPIRRPYRNGETVRVLAMLLAASLVETAILPAAAGAQSKDIFIPLLVYRTGPYASSGAPVANGRIDYYTLVNERDGGVNGVKIAWEECEFQYDTTKGIECYDKLKVKGAVLVSPLSTGLMYQLIPSAPTDKISVIQVGAGMTA